MMLFSKIHNRMQILISVLKVTSYLECGDIYFRGTCTIQPVIYASMILILCSYASKTKIHKNHTNKIISTVG